MDHVGFLFTSTFNVGGPNEAGEGEPRIREATKRTGERQGWGMEFGSWVSAAA